MSCCATGALAACAASSVGPGVLAFFVLFGYTARIWRVVRDRDVCPVVLVMLVSLA